MTLLSKLNAESRTAILVAVSVLLCLLIGLVALDRHILSDLLLERSNEKSSLLKNNIATDDGVLALKALISKASMVSRSTTIAANC